MKMFALFLSALIAKAACDECLDGYTCPGMMTCCQIPDGWGCCNYANAVCCEDKQHCCPSGMTCDLLRQQCNDTSSKVVLQVQKISSKLSQSAAEKVEAGERCEEGQQLCPKPYTCCVMPLNDYGCCPMQDAICCPDKVHCCPSGTSCAVDSRSCVQAESARKATLIGKKFGETGPDRVGTVCPDGGHCPGEYTCCIMRNGNYGCCPYYAATCCADREMCCPHNTRCGVANTCYPDETAVPYPFSTVRHPNDIPL